MHALITDKKGNAVGEVKPFGRQLPLPTQAYWDARNFIATSRRWRSQPGTPKEKQFFLREAHARWYEKLKTLLFQLPVQDMITVAVLQELIALEHAHAKPTDVCQLWYRTLQAYRSIFAEGTDEHLIITDMLRDLYMDQTLPFGEMDAKVTLYEGHADLDGEKAVNRTVPISEFSRRILEEYQGHQDLDAIMLANRAYVGDQGEEEEPWYEEGEMTSTAIRQNEEQEFRPNLVEIIEISQELNKLTSLATIKAKAHKIKADLAGKASAEEILRTIANHISNEYGAMMRSFFMVLARSYSVQNLYLATINYTSWMRETVFSHIPAYNEKREHLGSMSAWVQQWGDEILSEALETEVVTIDDPLQALNTHFFKKRRVFMTEVEQANDFSEETRRLFLKMCTTDRTAPPNKTRAYNEAYLRAVEAGDSNPTIPANRAWRQWISKRAALAFDTHRKFKAEMPEAWRGFWNTGCVTRWDDQHLWIVTDAKVEEVGHEWRWVRRRLQRMEIYVDPNWPQEKKVALWKELRSRGIPDQLSANLKK